LIARGQNLESTGKAVAASVFTVQPWMDIAEMGGSVVVVTDGVAKGADRYAASIAQRFWDIRRKFDAPLTPVEEAISAALATDGGPVILAESSDSTGSGSPGDSTGVLKHLIAAPLDGDAAIFVVDPEAVSALHLAGVDATVTVDIGGKLDRRNSKPVTVTGRVRSLSDGRWTPRARGYNPGIEQSMGSAAVLDVGRVRILVGERSTMTVDPALFRCFGIEPLYCKIVVVKSPNGFRAAYEPIAKRIFVVDTPGLSTANFTKLPWRRVSRPIYPLDPDVKWSA
jgi:microcystin degradation protein MlrC